MPGPILIVVALVLVIPVATLIGGAVMAIGLGWLVKTEVDLDHVGSELIELNT